MYIRRMPRERETEIVCVCYTACQETLKAYAEAEGLKSTTLNPTSCLMPIGELIAPLPT